MIWLNLSGALVSKQQQQISQDLPTPRKKKKGAPGEGADGEAAEGEAAPAEGEAAQAEAAAAEDGKTEEPKKPVSGWDFEETQVTLVVVASGHAQ